MSQSDIIMLALIGVILGVAAFFAFMHGKLAEDEHMYRCKEIDVMRSIMNCTTKLAQLPDIIKGLDDKLSEIKELEVQIYDICDRVEKRVSSLSADTMWTGGVDSGLSCTPESETSGDSGD